MPRKAAGGQTLITTARPRVSCPATRAKWRVEERGRGGWDEPLERGAISFTTSSTSTSTKRHEKRRTTRGPPVRIALDTPPPPPTQTAVAVSFTRLTGLSFACFWQSNSSVSGARGAEGILVTQLLSTPKFRMVSGQCGAPNTCFRGKRSANFKGRVKRALWA